MKDAITRELVISVCLILLLIVAAESGLFARSDTLLAFTAALTVMLGVFAILIRNSSDALDLPHDRRTGDRAAFFTAAGVLMAAILAESLSGAPVDVWLWAALAACLVAKGISFLRRKR
jgi:hypothetical protein